MEHICTFSDVSEYKASSKEVDNIISRGEPRMNVGGYIEVRMPSGFLFSIDPIMFNDGTIPVWFHRSG